MGLIPDEICIQNKQTHPSQIGKGTNKDRTLTHLEEVKVAVAGQFARFHLNGCDQTLNKSDQVNPPRVRVKTTVFISQPHHVTVDRPKLFTGGKPVKILKYTHKMQIKQLRH